MSEIVEEDQDTGCSITHYTVIHNSNTYGSYTCSIIHTYKNTGLQFIGIQEDTVKIVYRRCRYFHAA